MQATSPRVNLAIYWRLAIIGQAVFTYMCFSQAIVKIITIVIVKTT